MRTKICKIASAITLSTTLFVINQAAAGSCTILESNETKEDIIEALRSNIEYERERDGHRYTMDIHFRRYDAIFEECASVYRITITPKADVLGETSTYFLSKVDLKIIWLKIR